MDIKTKHNLQDTILIIHNDRIIKGIISEILYKKRGVYYRIFPNPYLDSKKLLDAVERHEEYCYDDMSELVEGYKYFS